MVSTAVAAAGYDDDDDDYDDNDDGDDDGNPCPFHIKVLSVSHSMGLVMMIKPKWWWYSLMFYDEVIQSYVANNYHLRRNT